MVRGVLLLPALPDVTPLRSPWVSSSYTLSPQALRDAAGVVRLPRTCVHGALSCARSVEAAGMLSCTMQSPPTSGSRYAGLCPSCRAYVLPSIRHPALWRAMLWMSSRLLRHPSKVGIRR